MALVTDKTLSEAGAEKLQEFMGPQMVDQEIRRAISWCWMVLPEGQKTVEAVEREIRRLVDRALKDLKEDMAAFGITDVKRAPRKSKRR
jgi:hypothetical protein